MELVGLKVHSDDKAGKDAGELCGLSKNGILATQNIDDIIAAKPDCVLYMQEGVVIEDRTDPEKNVSYEFKTTEIFKASDTMVDSLVRLLERERQKKAS